MHVAPSAEYTRIWESGDPPADEAARDRELEAVRRALGDECFGKCRLAGQAMSLEAAVADAVGRSSNQSGGLEFGDEV